MCVCSCLQGVYNVKRHPQFLNGQLSEEEILQKFLNNFEATGVQDGKVRRASFLKSTTFFFS